MRNRRVTPPYVLGPWDWSRQGTDIVYRAPVYSTSTRRPVWWVRIEPALLRTSGMTIYRAVVTDATGDVVATARKATVVAAKSWADAWVDEQSGDGDGAVVVVGAAVAT